MMYGENKWKFPLKDQMAARFPSIMEMLASLKKRNYRHAAHLMQNVESTMMIHEVCRRLMDKHPHKPIFTIHDSIITTPDHAATVRQIMLDTFVHIGIHPHIRMD